MANFAARNYFIQAATFIHCYNLCFAWLFINIGVQNNFCLKDILDIFDISQHMQIKFQILFYWILHSK